ncbi:hypothetical protein BOTCAL_0527g00080 [Botryotinia calthae]|uniref:Ig-like domain-containing protein n=1 Tax=Botryotinia calthae TaxID=38488 RepID=A0A4Y8CNA6_9HELO|nr:hypothetical protein BOTCAL_0527g00080 [Botryotinia calthae]
MLQIVVWAYLSCLVFAPTSRAIFCGSDRMLQNFRGTTINTSKPLRYLACKPDAKSIPSYNVTWFSSKSVVFASWYRAALLPRFNIQLAKPNDSETETVVNHRRSQVPLVPYKS